MSDRFDRWRRLVDQIELREPLWKMFGLSVDLGLQMNMETGGEERLNRAIEAHDLVVNWIIKHAAFDQWGKGELKYFDVLKMAEEERARDCVAKTG